MSYDNLERISASIFRPCENMDIKAIVKVAHKDKDGMRQYAHAEYDYQSNMYKDKKYLKSIKLSFTTHIVIEVTDRDWTENNTISIGFIQLPIVVSKLAEVVNWFKDDKYDKLYYYENSDLKINRMDFKDLSMPIILSPDKRMVITPTIIFVDNIQYEGVEILVNNQKCVGYVTVDYLFAMYYMLKHINLFDVGMSLMNYIGRPEFNRFNNTVVTNTPKFNNAPLESQSESFLKKDVPNKMLNGFFK